MSTPKPDSSNLGAMQREVLMLAEHGDVSTLKGVSAQRKALVRKGLLTADRHELTEAGHTQLVLEHQLQAPRIFMNLLNQLGSEFHRFAHMSNVQGYGSSHWVGAHSEDRRTAYVARRFAVKGNGADVHAIQAHTIPAEFRAFFGLKELS